MMPLVTFKLVCSPWENLGKSVLFPKWLPPDWGKTAQAAKAGSGCAGLSLYFTRPFLALGSSNTKAFALGDISNNFFHH